MKSDDSKAFNSFQDLKAVKEKMQQPKQQAKEKHQKRFEEMKKTIGQLKKTGIPINKPLQLG